VKPHRLRIAFATRAPTPVPVHEDCVAAVKDVAKLCADLGHEVTERSPEIDGNALPPAFITMWASCNAQAIDALGRIARRKPSPENLEPLTFALYQMGLQTSSVAYLHAVKWLQRMSRQIAHFFSDVDVWLSPTVAEPPLPLGTFDSAADNPMDAMFRASAFVPFTPIVNVTGQPAMSVPLYWNAAGLPIGTQFVGRFGDEATLFRLAAQLEEARPWAGRRPEGI
jgi:amidase